MTFVDATEGMRAEALATRPGGSSETAGLTGPERRRHRAERIGGVDQLEAEDREQHAAMLRARAVEARLANLGDDWVVLNSVPLGRAVIDQLVVGRSGVFVLLLSSVPERRTWLGSSRCEAQRRRSAELRTAYELRELVATQFGVAIGHAVPVFTAVVAPQHCLRRADGDASPVLRLTELARWLQLHPPVLTRDEFQRLLGAVEENGCLHFETSAAVD